MRKELILVRPTLGRQQTTISKTISKKPKVPPQFIQGNCGTEVGVYLQVGLEDQSNDRLGVSHRQRLAASVRN